MALAMNGAAGEDDDRYCAWQSAEVDATYQRVLKHDNTVGADQIKRLVQALCHKAALRFERPGRCEFTLSDGSVGYSAMHTYGQPVPGGNSHQGADAMFYAFYGELWEEYLRTVVAPACAAPSTNAEKLVELSKRYGQFLKILKVWSRLFMTLDRHYTPKKKLPSTKLVGFQKFRKIIFTGRESGVKDAVLDLILRDREGEPVDREQLKTIIRIFVDCGLRQVEGSTKKTGRMPEVVSLDMYEQDFEAEFLRQTVEFYRNKSSVWTTEDSFPDYMRKAERLYNEEQKRRQDYLNETTEEKLLEVIDNELVGEHQKSLLEDYESGYNTLLARYHDSKGEEPVNVEDLGRVYRMFKRLDASQETGVGPMATMTRDWIAKVGKGIVDDCNRKVKKNRDGSLSFDKRGRPETEDNLKELIDRLCASYSLYERLVHQIFQRDHLFMDALKEGFVTVMNLPHITIPAYTDKKGKEHKERAEEPAIKLADKFADLLASNGRQDEVLDEIQVCVSLFTLLKNKMLFLLTHQTFLAKRLLVLKTVNLDWENQTVQWLQPHVGARMVAPMAVMIQDKKQQDTMDQEWCNVSDQGMVNGIRTSVTVLTYGKWPNYVVKEIPGMHPAIQTCFAKFEEWYLQKRAQLILCPNWQLSSAELVMYYTGPRRIVNMNIPMACIMMLFEEDSSKVLTVQQICDLLKCDPEIVKDDLMTLTHNRDRSKELLDHIQLDKKARKIVMGDSISLNPKYRKGKSMKIDLLDFKAELGEDEIEALIQKTIDERQINIDTCIVRSIKRAEKHRLTHQQLLGAVINELSPYFPCPAAAVEARIRKLVDPPPGDTDGQLLKPLEEYNPDNYKGEYEYSPGGE